MIYHDFDVKGYLQAATSISQTEWFKIAVSEIYNLCRSCTVVL